jgi:hypothetical protein
MTFAHIRFADAPESCPAEDNEGPDDGDGHRTPQRSSIEGQPAQKDEGAAQMGHEQPVAAGGIQTEDAAPRRAARREILPDAHGQDGAEDIEEEGDGDAVPRHPAAQRLLPPVG